jgi:hypothetical protein
MCWGSVFSFLAMRARSLASRSACHFALRTALTAGSDLSPGVGPPTPATSRRFCRGSPRGRGEGILTVVGQAAWRLVREDSCQLVRVGPFLWREVFRVHPVGGTVSR